MSRKIVPVMTTDKGAKRPDYEGFNDAIYWFDSKEIADSLSEGEVSIIPHE